MRLADYTTIRLGGPARGFVRAGTDDELVEAVRTADAHGEPVLILGGGSNLVVADDGFDGIVIQVATQGVSHGDGPGVLTVAAGEDWDGFVARTVAEGLAGLECLSGIPGLAGATPIQNVGAYGQEVAQTLVAVRGYDRERGEVADLPAAWLIERAGFAKGYAPGPGGRGARISAKHTLALVNPGGATTASLLALAREIAGAVRKSFGVDLAPEPVLVGADL